MTSHSNFIAVRMSQKAKGAIHWNAPTMEVNGSKPMIDTVVNLLSRCSGNVDFGIVR